MAHAKPVTLPSRLAAGARVALVAPSGPCLDEQDIARASELCRTFGFLPTPGQHVRDRHGYFAGTDADRLADLNGAIRDPAIDAIWCVRGGYGLTRILDGVDFPALVRRPKAIIGFSDITALLAGTLSQAGIAAFHGPTARHAMPPFSREHFERVLCRPLAAGRLARLAPPLDAVPPGDSVVMLRPGVAEGPLVGGNLCLLQCLIGTRYFPDMDGAILFLEDVGEALYRVDRMLAHLTAVGALAKLAGVMIGRFTDMRHDTGEGSLGFDEVLVHYFGPLGIPVAHGFPVGHIDDQWTLPLGVRARLDATTGDVDLLEAAVS
jgi:muramoyltetrapeptide carboxypeptidase